MASPAQIAANRVNARKSSGPSPAGLAITRFNALKSGIDAKSLVIPGEDPAEFEILADNYRRQFQPASPVEVCLVDTLITADWELRRLRKIMPTVWDERAFLRPDSKEARRLDRLNRRLDATERSYHRALKELSKYAAARTALQAEQAEETEAAAEAAPNQELASFRTEQDPGILAPPPSPAAPQPDRQMTPVSRSERAPEAKPDPKINLALRL